MSFCVPEVISCSKRKLRGQSVYHYLYEVQVVRGLYFQ